MIIDSGKAGSTQSIGTGPFKTTSGSPYYRIGEGDFWSTAQNLVFDASIVVPTADENKPSNIAFTPIIFY